MNESVMPQFILNLGHQYDYSRGFLVLDRRLDSLGGNSVVLCDNTHIK